MLELKNGKFYQDGKQVPIEIGNKEQIDLIRKLEKEIDNGIRLNVNINEKTTYEMSYSFTCPCCGQRKSKECFYNDFEDEPDKDDIKDFIEEEEYSCYKCCTTFELKIENDGDYRLTIKKEDDEQN